MNSTRGTSIPHSWHRGALWLGFLGPFSFLSYGFANWIASQHVRVPGIVFDWEQKIPFIAWMVVPYFSLHLLFCLSFFICNNKKELDFLGCKLLTAQIIAVGCFIVFPLRYMFARPETEGVTGFLFFVLALFDKPYNQVPSLHVAVLIVLWAHYLRHTPRGRLILLQGWFVLIGFSVLTTYQHHFIDVPAGMLLGFLCLWFWDHLIVRQLSVVEIIALIGLRNQRVKNHGSK